MMFRGQKILQDREAGLVFDWRKGHGSFARLLISFVLVTILCGVLYAYVRVKAPEPVAQLEQGSAITIINLDLEENRWLSELIERESPFIESWNVQDDTRLNTEIKRALGKATIARPKLAELPPEEQVEGVKGLPGEAILPEPEPISWPKVARKPAKWWVEFEAPGNEWSDFAIPWESDKHFISAGESWSFLVGVAPSGAVVSCVELEGRGDPIAAILSTALKGEPFPAEKKATQVRWWKVVAVGVDRNASPEGESE